MNSQILIIAASGLANSAHIAQLDGLGVKHVLPKPYTAETLLKTSRRVLPWEFQSSVGKPARMRIQIIPSSNSQTRLEI